MQVFGISELEAEDLVHPCLVGDDDGNEDQGHAEHDLERHGRGGHVFDDHVKGRVQAGGQKRREQSNHCKQRETHDQQ